MYESDSQESNPMDLTPVDEENCTNENRNSIPAERPPRYFGKVGNLRSVLEIPEKYRGVFDFQFFNIVQSHVMDDVYYSDVSFVMSAPTASGKTAIFELGIIRLLLQMEDLIYSSNYKIVYVAPVKALCAERLEDWHRKFSDLGLFSVVVTGDSNIVDYNSLKKYNIILTTPEKWDALTRNTSTNKSLISEVKLFMIDEVHLLNEEVRGPVLEAIVSRMKILQESNNQIRFMAVSATIPNIEDLAEWLGHKKENAIYFKIGEELRPVKLKKVVLGYFCAPNCPSFKFEINLNYKLRAVIMEYSEGKPTLIFCSTRKGVELTAKQIAQDITFHLSPEQKISLTEAASTMLDNKMKSLLITGVGCHHAGMTPENRSTIENLFRSGYLPVLITTSTLAMGVNLPAHLVIIKSTQCYGNQGFQDYNESTLLQMIGRAGRPQYDTSATAVIMTKLSEKTRYEKMIGGTELIESSLHRHLTEHLIAEVVLHTITDIAVALDWLRSTFLYVRVLKNPKHYNIPPHFSKEKIEKKLQDLCQIEMNALARNGMLEIDQTDGFSVIPTNNGKLMTNYYLAFDTMKLFLEVKGNETLADILMTVSKCKEFSETLLRVNDKKTLNTLNRHKFMDTIRFPLPGKIKTTAMKVNCIIQAIFGCLKIQDPSLFQESSKIMRIGERVSKCLAEYLQNKKNCLLALLNALILAKCFHVKLWENSVYVSRQLPKIGPVLSSMLVTARKTTFKSLLEANPRDLERVINRSPPMGNNIQDAVMHLPFYRINLYPPEPNQYMKIKTTVTLLNPDSIQFECTAGLKSNMTLLVGDSENNVLICKKLQHSSMVINQVYSQHIDILVEKDQEIKAFLISENWVGIDCEATIKVLLKDIYEIRTNSNNCTVSRNESLETIKNPPEISLENFSSKKPGKNDTVRNIPKKLINKEKQINSNTNTISFGNKNNRSENLITSEYEPPKKNSNTNVNETNKPLIKYYEIDSAYNSSLNQSSQIQNNRIDEYINLGINTTNNRDRGENSINLRYKPAMKKLKINDNEKRITLSQKQHNPINTIYDSFLSQNSKPKNNNNTSDNIKQTSFINQKLLENENRINGKEKSCLSHFERISFEKNPRNSDNVGNKISGVTKHNGFLKDDAPEICEYDLREKNNYHFNATITNKSAKFDVNKIKNIDEHNKYPDNNYNTADYKQKNFNFNNTNTLSVETTSQKFVLDEKNNIDTSYEKQENNHNNDLSASSLQKSLNFDFQKPVKHSNGGKNNGLNKTESQINHHYVKISTPELTENVNISSSNSSPNNVSIKAIKLPTSFREFIKTKLFNEEKGVKGPFYPFDFDIGAKELVLSFLDEDSPKNTITPSSETIENNFSSKEAINSKETINNSNSFDNSSLYLKEEIPVKNLASNSKIYNESSPPKMLQNITYSSLSQDSLNLTYDCICQGSQTSYEASNKFDKKIDADNSITNWVLQAERSMCNEPDVFAKKQLNNRFVSVNEDIYYPEENISSLPIETQSYLLQNEDDIENQNLPLKSQFGDSPEHRDKPKMFDFGRNKHSFLYDFNKEKKNITRSEYGKEDKLYLKNPDIFENRFETINYEENDFRNLSASNHHYHEYCSQPIKKRKMYEHNNEAFPFPMANSNKENEYPEKKYYSSYINSSNPQQFCRQPLSEFYNSFNSYPSNEVNQFPYRRTRTSQPTFLNREIYKELNGLHTEVPEKTHTSYYSNSNDDIRKFSYLTQENMSNINYNPSLTRNRESLVDFSENPEDPSIYVEDEKTVQKNKKDELKSYFKHFKNNPKMKITHHHHQQPGQIVSVTIFERKETLV